MDVFWQVVSRIHRQALKLDAGHFMTSFRLEETTILAEVQQWAQSQPGSVTAQLQAVNIYRRGDFFTEHKDRAIAGGSFGTLIVGLPSPYTGKLPNVLHFMISTMPRAHTQERTKAWVEKGNMPTLVLALCDVYQNRKESLNCGCYTTAMQVNALPGACCLTSLALVCSLCLLVVGNPTPALSRVDSIWLTQCLTNQYHSGQAYKTWVGLSLLSRAIDGVYGFHNQICQQTASWL